MAEFTKGPWKVYIPPNYAGDGSLPSLGVESVESGDAVVWFTDIPDEGLKNDADAYLIAAAPELYDAVQVLLLNAYHYGVPSNPDHPLRIAVGFAESVIAKAEGKS